MSGEFMISGEPESVRAVERWIRSDVLDALADCIFVARRADALDYTYWDGPARNAFSGRLRETANGINATYELLSNVANLLGDTADGVGNINAAMSKSMDHVRQGGLKVEDGWVAEPELDDYVYPGSENTRTGPGGEGESARFEKMAEHYRSAEYFANRATKEANELADNFVSVYDNKYDFLVFAGIQYVNDAAQEWSRRSGYRAGLTFRMTKVGGPLIQAAGAVWSLYTGEPPVKVFLSVGVGLVVGAAVFVAIPAVVPAYLAVASSSVASAAGSWGTGVMYDSVAEKRNPELAREHLRSYIKSLGG